VAIIQISRITQRKGLQTDLPQPLAGAELGWATDQRRLFIGNGELSEGAPVVGNTEILTEFSDILSFTTAYTYQGLAAGYAVQTGASSTPVTTSIQNWMDQYASVKDFGAKGDGVTDDTEAINRALFQLYCRQVNPQVRRTLFFPAGVYKISNTINIPSYCKLEGDGSDGSILSFQVLLWTSAVSYDAGVLVENSGSYYRSKISVPPGTAISNTIYWENVPSLPECAVRTADSLQQTGSTIGLNGAISPRYISVNNVNISTDSLHEALLVEKCLSSNFEGVNIAGPLTQAQLNTASTNISAVAFSSSASLVCSDINFYNCDFGGFTYAVKTDQPLAGVVFSACWFDTLYQGIYLGGPIPVLGGATGVRIVHSVFDNIYAEGIVMNNVQLNASGYNVFYDVGNHFNGTTFPATSIININADQNISVGDMFQRTAAYATTYPRINLNFTSSIGIDSADKIQVGTFTRFSGTRTILDDNKSSPTAIFTIDANAARAFKVDYTILRDTNTRTGVFTVVASTDGTGSDLNSANDDLENASVGVTLSASETGSTVTVSYTTTSTGIAAEIYYSITKLA
jgi:hypothetical protein